VETAELSLIQKAAVANPSFVDELTDEELYALQFDWQSWARPSQLAPDGEWTTWLRMAGRGEGKTRSAAEWIRQRVDGGHMELYALLGRTPADVRDVMIEGESGLLNVFPPDQRPIYEPSRRRVTFYTGAIAHTYSAASPDELRGPQHGTAWVDELATFRGTEAWDNLQLGLRLGDPKQVVTTTPRPLRVLREMLTDPDTVVSRGTSYDNRANLARSFYNRIIRRYEGTHLGRQEIYGELLEEMPGALWRRDMILHHNPDEPLPDFVRIVIGVDPSVSDGEDSAECGIVIAAQIQTDASANSRFVVLGDWSMRGTPMAWAKRVVQAYHEFEADRVVAEENQGGKMVEAVLRQVDSGISYRGVHASRGKQARAEPISALYEQRRVNHSDVFPDLEDQLCNWVPGTEESPDRLDALVWALTDLVKRRRKVRMGAMIVGSASDG